MLVADPNPLVVAVLKNYFLFILIFIYGSNDSHQQPGHRPKTENEKALFPVGLDELVSA